MSKMSTHPCNTKEASLESALKAKRALAKHEKMESAIQHAIYMSVAAERFLEKTNALHFARSQGSDETSAELDLNEAFRDLKNAIYEFNKRIK